MSELISGKEARLAWANGDQLQVAHITMKEWEVLTDNYMLSVFDNGSYVFRLKPRTITLNGIEVPAPFEPKSGDMVWCLNELSEKGYEARTTYNSDDFTSHIAYWRTEDEIKQVVAALRKIFVINNQ